MASFEWKLPWDAYQAQLLADMNRWINAEKAAYLVISLRDVVATVLINLPPKNRQDHGTLTAALDSCFGVAHQTKLNWMRLKAREECLAELAEDVECLVHLAYPEVEVLAQDQFIDALPEEDIRLCIHQNKPATLRSAL